MNLFELLKEKRHQIYEIAQMHGAENIRVFGSVARGEETRDSDIDILIDIQDINKLSFFFPGGLIADLESLLGRKIDVVVESSVKPELKPQILKEAKAL